MHIWTICALVLLLVASAFAAKDGHNSSSSGSSNTEHASTTTSSSTTASSTAQDRPPSMHTLETGMAVDVTHLGPSIRILQAADMQHLAPHVAGAFWHYTSVMAERDDVRNIQRDDLQNLLNVIQQLVGDATEAWGTKQNDVERALARFLPNCLMEGHVRGDHDHLVATLQHALEDTNIIHPADRFRRCLEGMVEVYDLQLCPWNDQFDSCLDRGQGTIQVFYVVMLPCCLLCCCG